MRLQDELVRANLRVEAATRMHHGRIEDWNAALIKGGGDRREKARWALSASLEYLLDMQEQQTDIIRRMNGIEPFEAI